MIWYKKFYVDDSFAGNKDEQKKIVRELEEDMKASNIFVVALPKNDHDTLEILPSKMLRMSWFNKDEVVVVGFARGEDQAVKVVQKIIEDCYNKRKDFDVREFVSGKTVKIH